MIWLVIGFGARENDLFTKSEVATFTFAFSYCGWMIKKLNDWQKDFSLKNWEIVLLVFSTLGSILLVVIVLFMIALIGFDFPTNTR